MDEVLGLDLDLGVRFAAWFAGFAFPFQLHHVPTPGVIEGGHHSGPAVEVLPARASDNDPLAEERALGADFLVEYVQVCCCVGVPLGRGQCVQLSGPMVVFDNTKALLV